MITLATTLIGLSAGILGIEALLWWLFSRNLDGLVFPREVDASMLKFFTITRLRMIGLLHTLFLLLSVNLSFLLLW